MAPLRSRLRAFAALVIAPWVVACGAAAPHASGAPASTDMAPATIEGAQAQIDDAKRALGLASAGPSTPPAAPAAPAPPTDTGSAAASEPRGGATPAPSRREEGEASEKESVCASSCRAIASMRRAVTSLCRLAGDDDARCVEAKGTLDAGERRVVSCGC